MAALTTIALVAGAVLAAAGTGVAVHNTQETERATKDAGRDQENSLLAQQGAANQQKAQSDAEQDAVMARARQKAVASMSGGSTYGGTLKTSSLGVPSTPMVSNKSLLGL